ncbi:MAG: polyprenyl synthetase family protein [Anaerolineaceae bacterium]
MILDSLMIEMLPKIEDTLKDMVYKKIPQQYTGIVEMMSYHMGWTNSIEKQKGKRIRPIILLLSTKICGGEWQKALPAAAAVELLHNFSLIHDDIEDQSEFRHGRNTVWKLWGLSQAINTGDAMFSLSQLGILDLGKLVNIEVAYESIKVFNLTCVSLTGGQYLDMTFENDKEISSDNYFQMVSGKTAALLAASTEIGAIVAQTTIANRKHLHTFGEALGLAFQAQDDYLGIWGEEALTGKSRSSDLKSGKKTLPVVFAFEKMPELKEKFCKKPINDDEIDERAMILENLGAKKYTESVTKHYTNLAIQSLNAVEISDKKAYQALLELTNFLLTRNK